MRRRERTVSESYTGSLHVGVESKRFCVQYNSNISPYRPVALICDDVAKKPRWPSVDATLHVVACQPLAMQTHGHIEHQLE